MEAKFYVIFGTFFLLSVLLMIHVNSRLMRHADKRLESVHKMVDRMAGSADKLAESICRMKDIISEMKEEDNSRIKQLIKNRMTSAKPTTSCFRPTRWRGRRRKKSTTPTSQPSKTLPPDRQ